MSAHASVEVLSAYLDNELEPRRAISVAGHLEECHRCRSELESLQQVVASLGALEAPMAPGSLDTSVRQAVQSATVGEGFKARARRSRDRLRRDPSLAVWSLPWVLALSVIVYLFAAGLIWRQSGPEPSIDASQPLVRVVSSGSSEGDREFVWLDGAWIEVGRRALGGEDGAQRNRLVERVLDPRQLADRLWLEEQVDPAPLAALASPVRLELAGKWVEVRFDYGWPD